MNRKFFNIKRMILILWVFVCFGVLGDMQIFASTVETEAESEFKAEYESVKARMFSNIQDFGALTPGALPCVGSPKILVFYTTFVGGNQNWTLSKEEVESFFLDRTPGVESLSNYYYTSSYGKVEIVGDVYEYTTQYDTGHYNDVGQVMDEIIEYYKDEIRWEDYDTNHDGYLDGVYLVARTKHSWGGPNFVSTYSKSLGDVCICKACFIDSQDMSTLCHETCHMFGPADMYVGVGLNPAGTKTDTIMESCGLGGDLPGITKFVLGWIDNPNFIKGTGTFELTLDSYSTNSEIAIIFPNGDSSNENWMVMEYLTPEGNNHYKGVRIWKTCMNLDENYNIRGSSEFASGMPSSPYEYLVTVYPNEEGNYYYGAGESLTPYTNPSTCYGKSYKWVGNSKHIDEIGFSGIYIDIHGIDERSASITVTINNDVEEVFTEASIVYGCSNAEFINDSKRLLIATVTADTEMQLVDKVVLEDTSNGISYDVETAASGDKKTLYFYIKNSDVKALKTNTNYKINLESAIKTYFGGDILIEQFDGMIFFEYIPVSCEESEFYPNGATVYREFYYPEYFKTGVNEVSALFCENNALWLSVIDTAQKTFSRVQLKTNAKEEISSIARVWLGEQKNYLVALKNPGDQIIYLALYDLYGNLLDDYTIKNTSYLNYITTNGFLYQDGNCYIISIQDEGIVFQPSAFSESQYVPENGSWYNYNYIRNNYFSRVENLENGQIRLAIINGSNQTEIYVDELASEKIHIEFYQNQYYVVYYDSNNNIKMNIYDQRFSLKKSVELLKNVGITFLESINLGFKESGYYVNFNAVPSSNDIAYSSTFLLNYDKNDKLINYYRYGDSTFRYCGDIMYVGNGEFILGIENRYCILRANKEQSDVENDTSLPFTDVSSDKWYYNAVKWASTKGLLTGTSDTTFAPNDPMTRGMLVTVLYRMEGRPSISATIKFADVISSKYYAKAIAWASSQNIVSGYSNGKFGPEDSITREQLAKVLYLYADYKGYDVTAKESLSAFNDASNVSSYAKKYMQWAVAEGLIKGSNGKLKPKGEATRAEIAAILKRFIERYE